MMYIYCEVKIEPFAVLLERVKGAKYEIRIDFDEVVVAELFDQAVS